MKFLIKLKENINLISFIAGVGFIIAGRKEVGEVILQHGASL